MAGKQDPRDQDPFPTTGWGPWDTVNPYATTSWVQPHDVPPQDWW